MARTTDTLVKGVIEVDAKSVPDLTPFITTANLLVTELCVLQGYTDERLELIERWLSAHFYAIRDNRIASESPGEGVYTSYQFKLGLMLASTMYGQQVMILDTSGALAHISKQAETGRRKLNIGISYIGGRTGGLSDQCQ